MTRPIRSLPSALERSDEMVGRLEGRAPAVFLDYDGTLAPIVPDPTRAEMLDATREAVRRLSERCPVAVVSGRDLDDVRSLVGVEGIHYAGSHGFDVLDPEGVRHERGREYRPVLERAAEGLEPELETVPGATLERKRFALAVHYRKVERPEDATRVEEAVDRVVADDPRLRKTGGKKVFEVRPDVDWDKGRAVLWILEVLGLEGEGVLPLYVGDDVTDEDAFRALDGRGVGIVVRGEDDDRGTAADYALDDTDAVRRFLEWLTDRLDPPSSPRLA